MTENTTSRKEFLQAAAGVTAGAAFFGTMGFNRLASAEHHEGGESHITQIARLTMQEGKEEEAMSTFRGLVEAVEANEPGVLAYSAYRSESNPSELVVFEIYQDAAALAAHTSADHMKAAMGSFMQLFKPPLNIEKLSSVQGFMR